MRERKGEGQQMPDFGGTAYRRIFRLFGGFALFFLLCVAIWLPQTDKWVESQLYKWQMDWFGGTSMILSIILNFLVLLIGIGLAFLMIYVPYRLLMRFLGR